MSGGRFSKAFITIPRLIAVAFDGDELLISLWSFERGSKSGLRPYLREPSRARRLANIPINVVSIPCFGSKRGTALQSDVNISWTKSSASL